MTIEQIHIRWRYITSTSSTKFGFKTNDETVFQREEIVWQQRIKQGLNKVWCKTCVYQPVKIRCRLKRFTYDGVA